MFRLRFNFKNKKYDKSQEYLFDYSAENRNNTASEQKNADKMPISADKMPINNLSAQQK